MLVIIRRKSFIYSSVLIFSSVLLALIFWGVFYTQNEALAAADCTWTTQTLDPNTGSCTGGVCTCNDLIIASGQTVTVPSTITSIVVEGGADIEGILTANTQGEPTGIGSGAGGDATGGDVWNGGGGGGGYGGNGGAGHLGSQNTSGGIAGSYYGINTNPTDLGSGGGSCGINGAPSIYGVGGSGGGLINMMVTGTLTVNGTISANGENGAVGNNDETERGGGGGGSGGSININTNIISGSGTIIVNGGNGGNGAPNNSGGGGGGGGGRIAIFYDAQSSLSITSSAVNGLGGWGAIGSGSNGSYGSVIIFDQNDTPGDLSDDDVTIVGGFDFDNTTFPATNTTYNSITISSASFLRSIVNAAVFTTTGGFVVDGSSNSWLSTQDITIDSADIDITNLTLSDTGKLAIMSDADLDIIFSTMSWVNSISDDWTITEDANLLSGSNLTGNVNITATNITVESGSILSVNGMGSSRTLGIGPGTDATGDSGHNGGGGGAGYGGIGGAGGAGTQNTTPGTAGSIYGSNIDPVNLGSGGGSCAGGTNGGSGGGVIDLSVSDTLTIEGSVNANGQDGGVGTSVGSLRGGGGGGSGGAININTNTIFGSGVITANGGDGGNGVNTYGGGGGGGGGGRIAIYSVIQDSWNVVPTVAFGSAGARAGGSGTVVGIAGSIGTIYTLQYNHPPDISFPADESTEITTKPTLSSDSIYSGYNTHVSSDWRVCTDSDCNNIVWYKNDDGVNLASIVVNDTNGTFQGALTDHVALALGAIYYVQAQYTDSIDGDFGWSDAGHSFTTNLSLGGIVLATGGTITYDGSATIHTYTSSGTFTPSSSFNLETLIVAGGGGGGGNHGGGGAAGGIVYHGSSSVISQAYTVTVGGGGSGNLKNSGGGTNGGNSIFNGITAIGGGHGGGYSSATGSTTGGSGAGGTARSGVDSGAAATQGDSSGGIGYGNAGGSATARTEWQGGGGGGAGGVGGNSGSNGGNGGVGLAYDISGSLIYYAGGGGGGGRNGVVGTQGIGGFGGGGNGGYSATDSTAGTANTGGGGGGQRDGDGKSGGSGIVIIKYELELVPSVSSPSNGAINVSRNPSITSSAFSGPNAHIYSDWRICAVSDCSSDIVWIKETDSTNKTNIEVNDTNGNFQGVLVGQDRLAKSTTYYVQVQYVDGEFGEGGWSVDSYSFTTDNTNNTPVITIIGIPEQSIDGVNIDYKLIDNEENSTDIDIYEYSLNNSDWLTMTEKVGVESDGVFGLASSASPGISHDFVWDVQTDEDDTDDSSVWVRLRPDNGTQGLIVISSSFTIDVLDPTSGADVDIQSRPVAGDTTVNIDGSFTETNPDTNEFYLEVNGGGYGSADMGDSDTADPSNLATNAEKTLDGADCITRVKITHADDYGSIGTNENINPSIKCVIPYTPASPIIDNPTANTMGVTVNAHTSEDSGLEYAIQEITTGNYVQADGSLGVTADWQDDTTWGTQTVAGLSSPVSQYSFQVKSRSSQDNAVESAFSASTSENNTTSTTSIDLVAQDVDGNGLVVINYTISDPQSDTQSLATYEYSADNSTWLTMTEDSGDGTSGLTSSVAGTAHTFIWDVGIDLVDKEDSTVYVRLTSNDGVGNGNIETSSAFEVDTLAPTSLANLAVDAYTSTTADLSWTIASETNFGHYEIWYGPNENDVQNKIDTASEWDDTDDTDLAGITADSTTITDLSEGTIYLSIFAIDNYGNEFLTDNTIVTIDILVAPVIISVELTDIQAVSTSDLSRNNIKNIIVSSESYKSVDIEMNGTKVSQNSYVSINIDQSDEDVLFGPIFGTAWSYSHPNLILETGDHTITASVIDPVTSIESAESDPYAFTIAGDGDEDQDEKEKIQPDSLGIIITNKTFIKVLDEDGNEVSSFNAYGDNLDGNTHTVQADIDGDGINEIITSTGSGLGPNIRAFSQDGTLIDWFMAYDEDFRGGVNVVVGDFNGDGSDELAIIPLNGKSNLRIYDLTNNSFTLLDWLFVYDERYIWGADLTTGDVDGDGSDEIIVSPKKHGGPNVRIFSLNDYKLELLDWFYAYQPEFHGGVNITTGDLDGNGTDEIITAPASLGGSNIRAFTYTNNKFKLLDWFMAYGPGTRGGFNITSGDLNNDNKAELVVAPGEGMAPNLRVYEYDTEFFLIDWEMVYDSSFSGGVNLEILDIDSNGRTELITIPMTGKKNIRLYSLIDNSLELLNWFWGE